MKHLFMIYQSSSRKEKGQWRWRIRSINGETIMSGEAYHNLADLLTAVRNVFADTSIHEQINSMAGKHDE